MATPNPEVSPVILDKGRIDGTWEVGKGGAIALKPFEKLTRRSLTALQSHVLERYHGLLGDPARA